MHMPKKWAEDWARREAVGFARIDARIEKDNSANCDVSAISHPIPEHCQKTLISLA
jgi:hypothetical protein